MKNLFSKSYYKLRIIITFSLLTIFIVITLSRISYLFIRKLYLDQVSEQVYSLPIIISKQIEPKYISVLKVGIPTESINNYFRNIFSKFNNNSSISEVFIFDNDLKLVTHQNTNKILGVVDPRLLINQKEIRELQVNRSVVTLPFKGDDGQWYLWGFYRLDNQLWLAIRESASRLEKVENLSSIFWGVGIAGTLLTILLGWIAANSITKPINKLVNFSTEIGKGNLNYKSPDNMYGEIGVLAAAMDKMRTEIMNHQKEKENILAQIAHEIRNPLGGIELLANLTKEDLIENNKDVEYLNKILDEISKLKSLITSYLSYSRPMPANPDWVELENIYKEIENIFNSRLCSKNIKLTFTGSLKKIYFDPIHLRNILVNLISNSIDVVDGNGLINVVSEKGDNSWSVSVIDNGPGIQKENITKIFEPFFTTKKEGTGLGLAISNKLCIENNSKLILEDTGEGRCIFTITKEI